MAEPSERPAPPRVSYIHSAPLIRTGDCLPSNEGRASVVHNLIAALNLIPNNTPGSSNPDDLNQAAVIPSVPATPDELARFHDPAFVGKSVYSSA